MDGSGHFGTPDGTRVLDRMRELDTRKRASAKVGQDAQRKRERERKRLQRQRLKAAKAVQTGQDNAGQCETAPVLTDAQKTALFSQLFDVPDAKPPKENRIRTDLLRLSKDRKAPASARVTALRTVAEMDGHIGKLQSASADTTDQPLASMTRAQLEDELRRLRAKQAGDVAPK